MNIEITNQEGTGVDRHVQVSVPVESVKAAEDKAARRYASSVRLPGFRPGKAPAQMVRKKFADAIRQEALEAIVRDAYKEVVEMQDLKVASQRVEFLKHSASNRTAAKQCNPRGPLILFDICEPVGNITDRRAGRRIERSDLN